MKNSFFIVFALLFCSINLQAYEMKYVIATPASYTAGDNVTPKLISSDPNIGLTTTPTYAYKVNLKYTRTQLTDIVGKSVWDYTLTLVLKIKDANGNLVGTTAAFNLALKYNGTTDPTGNIYEDVALYNIQYASWVNNPRAELYVTAVNSTILANVPVDIALELTQIQTVTDALDTSTDPRLSKAADNKTISWDYIAGAQWYELEWVYIDAYDGTTTFASIADAFAYKEPIRITTPAQSFSFHNTYSKGAVYFRVRASTSVFQQTNWYYSSATTIVNTIDFEPLKNWQTTTDFIENGRYKKSIEFIDGSMRARQTQHSVNSDKTVMVSETKYDFEGRPVVDIMPFPYGGSTGMNYISNLNTFNVAQAGNHPKTAYDNQTGSLSLMTTSGAAQYYSPSNPFAASITRNYTPDAQGYAYSQVVYTPDNTGRIAKSADVGAAFHIQTPTKAQDQHFVQNFYGTPSSTELYRMFGSNVGQSSHYSKNYTIDENGVISISYHDSQKRVIATALSEKPTNNLISVSDPYNQSLLLNGNGKSVHRLGNANEVDPAAHTSISTDKIVNLQEGQVYTFKYDLNSSLDAIGGICLTCAYTLEIRATGPDGKSIIKDPNNLSVYIPYYTQDLIPTVSGCSTATYPVVQLPLTFDYVGEYTITKKLYYNTTSIQALNTVIAAGSSATIALDDQIYTDQASFVTAYVAKKQAEANCGFTCDDNCINYKNTFTNKKNPATGTFYTATELTAIYNQCMTGCSAEPAAIVDKTASDRCASYKQQMLDQLSPGGYYYQQTDFIDNLIAGGLVFTPVSGTIPVTAAQVEDPDQFVSQWALDMFPKHIEYCIYTNTCVSQNPSDNTTLVAALNTRDTYEMFQFGNGDPTNGSKDWAAAAANGFLRPINMTVPAFTVASTPTTSTFDLSTVPTTHLDPFFTSPSTQSSTTLQNTLLNYYDENYVDPSNSANNHIDYNGDGVKTVLSLWQYVSYYNRKGDGTWNNVLPVDYDVNRWAIFKGIYLREKDKYIQTLIQSGCANGYQDPKLDQTVIRVQPQTVDQAAWSTWAKGQVASAGICSDQVCQSRAQSMLREIALSCSGLSTLTKLDSDEILYNLYKYIQSGCSSNNPQMQVLSTDIATNSYLIRVNTILSGYSCSLYSIAVSNPYINCNLITPGANDQVPSSYILNYIDLINDYLNINRNNIGSTPMVGNPYGNCSSVNVNTINFAPINTFPSGKANSDFWYYWLKVYYIAITQDAITNDIQVYFKDNSGNLFFSESGLLETVETMNLKLSSIKSINNLTAKSCPCSQILTPTVLDYQITQMDNTASNYSVGQSGNGGGWNYFLIQNNCSTLSTYCVYINSKPAYSLCTQTSNPTPDNCGYMPQSTDPFWYAFCPWKEKQKCIDEQNIIATAEANEIWNAAIDQQVQAKLGTHYSGCFSTPFKENFYYETDELKQLYYTLYYYDQAGNLVQTVPPEGVRLLGADAFDAAGKGEYLGILQPPHGLITHCKYNSLNQIIYKMTPDESGPNHNIPAYTFYNDKGQVVLSQNARQRASNTFSCINYDKLGRVNKAGDIVNATLLTDLIDRSKYDQNVTNYWNADLFTTANAPTDLIVNTYDTPIGGDLSYTGRGRVTNVSRSLNLPSFTAGTFDSYITYQYDIHGNVKTLVNTLPLSGNVPTNGVKLAFTVDYTFDLLSGSVKQVILDNGIASQFIHKYCYDADNRLKTVKTSRNGLVWEEDARYSYYLHGPLARKELGEDRVQGSDYYYTLQGWIKGVNIPGVQGVQTCSFDGTAYNRSGLIDLSGDGVTSTNAYVGQDEYMMSLGYYDTDYSPIGLSPRLLPIPGNNIMPLSQTNLWPVFNSTANSGGLKGLYDGNIAFWIGDRSRSSSTEGRSRDNVYVYKYDQLDRLRNAYYMNTYMVGDDFVWNSRTITTVPQKNDFSASYDLNGNIKTMRRSDPLNQVIDTLAYNYTYQGTGATLMLQDNKLTSIGDDPSASGLATYDIDAQSANNYTYDNIGNLIGDVAEQIASITWNREGKVTSLTRISTSTKPDFIFKYDVNGKRIYKQVNNKTAAGAIDNSKTTYVYYAYDGSGNLLATYDRAAISSLYDIRQVDVSILGSDREGVYAHATPVTRNVFLNNAFRPITLVTSGFQRLPAYKQYELKDHLGNVRTVITGIKIGVNVSAGNTADFYTPDVFAENDYYPFGMQINGGYRRTTTLTYKFGYNGKPMDADWNGDGAMYDYGFRIYDPRICKFLSVDPLAPSYPELTPYQFASNTPIQAIDLDGLESFYSADGKLQWKYGTSSEIRVVDESFVDVNGGCSVTLGQLLRSSWVGVKLANGTVEAKSYNLNAQVLNTKSASLQRQENQEIQEQFHKAISRATPSPMPTTKEILSSPMASGRAEPDFSTSLMVGGLVSGTFELTYSLTYRALTSQGGLTFAQYKAAMGGTEPLVKIWSSTGTQRISTEFHHVFITQRMQKAYNIPNWAVNNRVNVWKLNTVQHSLIDSYRYNFLRAGFKSDVGWFKKHNWFTNYSNYSK